MLLYGIDVHVFFPPTMHTPGYEEENKTKPKITLKIEESDDGLTPDQAALALFQGMSSFLLTRGFSEGLRLPGAWARVFPCVLARMEKLWHQKLRPEYTSY